MECRPLIQKYVIPIVMGFSVLALSGCYGDGVKNERSLYGNPIQTDCPDYTTLVSGDCIAWTPDPMIATPQPVR